jgi:ankyrin repeat protein
MTDFDQVSVDAVDEFGNTVLIVAAQNNNKRICKAVLRRGANIRHQNNMGQTCLHFAFALGYNALGEYLISKGGSQTLQNT